MAQQVPFRKLHGLGNDFLVVDLIDHPQLVDALVQPDLAVRLCERHTGVGGDGVILLLTAQGADNDSRMIVLNGDGSRPEMCGNGIRCAAKLLADQRSTLHGRDQLRIETDAGLRTCHLTQAEDGSIDQVRVEMGRPVLDREKLPMQGSGGFVESPFSVAHRTLVSTAVSMGNPHLVTFVGGQESPEQLTRELGPEIETHSAFPQRTNVEFAKQHGDEIELWVWERGVGITQACGTGACATATAAVLSGRAQGGQPLTVRLPGGRLTIEVANDLSQVWMTGPAEDVFAGAFTL